MRLQDRDLARALARLADDVHFEDAEVDAAFTAFTARAGRAWGRRRRQRLVAACAAIAAVLGGSAAWLGLDRGTNRLAPSVPAPTRTVISAQDLVGLWTGNGLWTFYADGTGGHSNNADLLEVPLSYTLKGDRLGVRDGDQCGYSFRLTTYERGTLTVDPLDYCGNPHEPITFVRLSPASPAGMALPMSSMTGAAPVRTVTQLSGVWQLPGTGVVLAIDTSDPKGATYALDDRGDLARSPRDRGAVSVEPDGTVTLSSSQEPTAGCVSPSGPRIVLRSVQVVAGQSLDATGGVDSNCPRVTVDRGWVMLSDR